MHIKKRDTADVNTAGVEASNLYYAGSFQVV